jgi:hypothetical protein
MNRQGSIKNDCKINLVSSRACECGTKGCEVQHDRQAETVVIPRHARNHESVKREHRKHAGICLLCPLLDTMYPECIKYV